MKLEQQVVSLELSKRLKEFGVKQESLFFWNKYGDKWLLDKHSNSDLDKNDGYSAFTVAELGEMLPNFVESYKSHDDGFNWFCRRFVDGDISKYNALQTANTEADARAKMLIYLLENKLITL